MSANWKTAKLSDLVIFQRGFDITKVDQSNGDIPIISSSGITSFHNIAKQIGPAIIIGRKGTLGSVHFYDKEYWPHDTTLWSKELKGHPKFVYYMLKTLKLEQYDVGNANPTLNRNHIHKLDVLVPSFQAQQKIAFILSAYDDLIENNLNRIKLLEEMAQITYEEWFVRLKFPGHETTTMDFETHLPVGWKKRSLLSVANFLNGYAFKPEDLGENGYPVIKIKEIKNGVESSTPRNQGKDIPDRYIVNEGDILFSWSASLEVVIWQHETGLLNQHLFKVMPNCDLPKSFLYLALKESLPIFDNLTTGATMKHIKRKELDFVKIVVPDKDLLDEFNKFADSTFQAVLNLNRQIRFLKEARDILLPRLMTGMIDVEQLVLPEPIQQYAIKS